MSNDKFIVSAIIPTYNRADLVAPAIQSVIDQTYQDIEIIVVDDGSTDNTEEVVNEFVNRDPRVRYIKHEKNKGGSAARNTGIKNARGEYIAFMDSDCQWLPEKIEKQIEIFTKGVPNLGAVGTGKFSVVGNSTTIGVRKGQFGDIYKKLLAGEGFPGGKDGWPGGTPTIMIKRECFERIGLFDEFLESCQEYDLYIRISKYYYFDAVREPLVKVVSDAPDGISANQQAKLNGRMRMLKKYSAEMPRISMLRSRFCHSVGNIFCRQGRMWEGRKYLLRAIVAYPFILRNWIYFAASLLPYSFYKQLRSIVSKHRRAVE